MNYSRRLENVLQQINLNKTIYKNFQNISFLKKPVQIMRNCVKILLRSLQIFIINKRKNSNLTQINSIDDIISFN
jgi:hypothetical protein